jgi:hypothetical protein
MVRGPRVEPSALAVLRPASLLTDPHSAGLFFRDLGNEFARVGAKRVGISTDTVDKQAHFAQQRSFDYPLRSDEDTVVSELLGVRRGRLPKLRRSVVAHAAARRGRHSRRRRCRWPAAV